MFDPFRVEVFAKGFRGRCPGLFTSSPPGTCAWGLKNGCKAAKMGPAQEPRLFEDAAVALIISDSDHLEIADRAVWNNLWRFGDVRAKTSL